MSDAERPIERITQLENALARMRVLIAGMLLCGAAVLIAGATGGAAGTTGEESIHKARGFVLVDEDGRERALLGFRNGGAGVYLYARSPKDDAPLVTLEVKGAVTQAPSELADVETAHAEFRSELLATIARIDPEAIRLSNREKAESVGLSYINSPSLDFRDKSGFPFISLSYSHDRQEARFELREPLGIEDAWGKVGRL